MLIEELERKFKELKNEGISEDAIVIAFKEEFHHYILHFIYTSKKFSNLTMYGGSVLRIGYELPRMSEDLDFQTAEKVNKVEFKSDLESYFKNNLNLNAEVSYGDGSYKETDIFMVKFDILKKFALKNNTWSKLKIRVDVNYFNQADNFIKDTISKIHNNLVYTIKTYPLSTLMASKTVALLNRDKRGIGPEDTNVKPRDVFDMMWYMEKKIMPDLEYLRVKNYDFNNFLELRDRLKIRANLVDEKLFVNDLSQFFYQPSEFQSWLVNWRPKFIQLLNEYEVYEIGDLDVIYFSTEFVSENRLIIYKFSTLNGSSLRINFAVSITDNWFSFGDYQIGSGQRVKEIEPKIKLSLDREIKEVEYEYIGLFYKKIIDFINRSNNIVYQESFLTKKIRTSADNLNIRKEICLDRLLLKKIKFEELT